MRHALSRLFLAIALLLPASAALAQEAAPAAAAAATTATPAPQDAARLAAILRDDRQRADLLATLDALAAAAPAASAAAPAAEATAAEPAPPADAVVQDGLLTQMLSRSSAAVRAASDQVHDGVVAMADLGRLGFWLNRIATDPDQRRAVLTALSALVLILLCGLAAEWLTRRALRRPLETLLGRGEARLSRDIVAPPPAAPPPAADTQASPEEAAIAAEPPVDAVDPGPPEPLQTDAAATAATEPTAAPASVGEAVRVRAERRLRALQAAGKIVRRLPLALARAVLEALPVIAFAVTVNLLLGSGVGIVQSETTRVTVLAFTGAYIAWRWARVLSTAVVAPTAPGLRLLTVGDGSARSIHRWFLRLCAVGFFGAAALEAARALGILPTTYAALWKLLILVQHILVAIIVLKLRHRVARMLHAPQGAHGAFAVLRNLAAMTWHIVAIFVIVALWAVWALGIEDGYRHILRLLFVTAVALTAMRALSLLAMGGLDRLFRLRIPALAASAGGAESAALSAAVEQRAGRWYPLARRVVTAILWLITGVVLLQVWGVDMLGWFAQSDSVGRRLASAALVVLVAAAVAIVTWEGANYGIDRKLAGLTAAGDINRAARLRTLLPLLRSVLLVVVAGIVVLTALSELGLNIAPLLAGASIIGVAVGFGSQKLVQDVITGIFLLLENTMQVGDFVTAAGLSGTVEALTVRTVRLRAGDGAVHFIPFSSVDKVTNTNRDIANAMIQVDVAYSVDTDTVVALMKEASASMRADPAFSALMLDDLALWGVDRIDVSGTTVKGTIKTVASGRWPVQREFNRRIKKLFERDGVAVAAPPGSTVMMEGRG